MTETSGPGLRHVVGRWWPALVGLVGVVSLIDIKPWKPSDPTAAILPGLAVAYLVFGAARRQLGRPGVLRLQILGLLIFGGCALLGVLVEPEIGHWEPRGSAMRHGMSRTTAT